ncbi:MAG: N-formylglutamate amidohydrolase, partial [Planctomycetaceae bacterium]
MNATAFQITRLGAGPIVATAIHDGHSLRPDVAELIALDEAQRLREEDPYTGLFVRVADTQVIGLRSRFEVDFNRSRDQAIYLQPQDAWGLDVWRTPPCQQLIARSLQEYDEFYAAVERLLGELLKQHGRLVVFDIHSYNHRRDGADAPPS